jgi:hypothetical protein
MDIPDKAGSYLQAEWVKECILKLKYNKWFIYELQYL